MNTTGSLTCFRCARGHYQSSSGQTSCLLCPPGNFASVVGMSSCSSWATGRYATNTSSIYCIDCSFGRAQGSAGQTRCSFCPPGQYSKPLAAAAFNAPPELHRRRSGPHHVSLVNPAGFKAEPGLWPAKLVPLEDLLERSVCMYVILPLPQCREE
jgi:hypothetical protein